MILNTELMEYIKMAVKTEIKNSIRYAKTFLFKILICMFYFSVFFLYAQNTNKKIDYREEMRKFVISISEYGKKYNPHFIVVPQNGHELITDDGTENGSVHKKYISAISGVGRESLFYGYAKDNEPTPENEKKQMLALCSLFKKYGKKVLVTDYCSGKKKADDSYFKNKQNGFISFAADDRELSTIPAYPLKPRDSSSEHIDKIEKAKNFIFLPNPKNYDTKTQFVKALADTDFDILIIDLFHFDEALTKSDLHKLKTKHGGGRRLVLSYLSIGEAEDYRYYYRSGWKTLKPEWLKNENPLWRGNYIVKYWNKEWQRIITGNKNSYLHKIINADFDGVYLDIIDAFENFEK